MYVYFRLPDNRCLYLNEKNEFGDQCIIVEEMTSSSDFRFWWSEDSEHGVIRSFFDPCGCIAFQGRSTCYLIVYYVVHIIIYSH